MRSYRFLMAAFLEYEAQVAWLKNEAPAGVAERFIVTFEHGMNQICEWSEAGPVVYEPDIRQKVLRSFSVTVFYRALDEEIIVFAVADQRRRPGYWLRRREPK